MTVTATPAPAPTVTVTATPGVTSGYEPLPTYSSKDFSGIDRYKQYPADQLGLRALHAQGIDGRGTSIAFIDHSMVADPAFTAGSYVCVGVRADGVFGERACPTTTPWDSHGQGVAGTMGGRDGVAPGARVISVNMSGPQGAPIVTGLRWVRDNQKAYNITAVSLSVAMFGPRANSVCGFASPSGLREVLNDLADLDIAVVVALGNLGGTSGVYGWTCLPGVIGVGATSAEDPYAVEEYSNTGLNVDMLAPSGFLTPDLNGGTMTFGGTSAAAPFVAGVFALARQVRPDASTGQIFYLMRQTGFSVDDVVMSQIPLLQPKRLIAALQSGERLPNVRLVREFQRKQG